MTQAASLPLFGIILAGGSGTRFWPLSRSQYPKQVLRLLGSESMLRPLAGASCPISPQSAWRWLLLSLRPMSSAWISTARA
jgi:dTDP-glucose pyrophosphorylase